VKTISVKIFQDKIWFNSDLNLSLDLTNLPFKYFKFSQRPIFWLLEMKSYDKDSFTLKVNVLNFNEPFKESWLLQRPKAQVSRLHFLHLDWGAFCSCLSFYQSDAKIMLPFDPNSESNNNVKYHSMEVSVPISSLKIGHGTVSFKKKFKWSDEKIEIVISQVNMIPEYEYIKPYFFKILKKKTINVNVSLKIVDKIIEIIDSESTDLNSIDNDAIYIVKSYKIDNWKRLAKDTVKGTLLFDSSSNEFSQSDFGNIDEFEREILFHILKDNDIRNKPQLNYLANILLDSQKLMLSVEPQFGFVFVVKGVEMVHCVWELVNSHGTYIWSFKGEKFGEIQLKSLEHEFSILSQFGRSHYRNNVENSDQLFFNIVQHKRNDDPIIDHFGKWKVELEKLFI